MGEKTIGGWTNYGDVNFTEYGGVMVRPKEYDDGVREGDYEFFMLTVTDDSEKKRYAYHGTVCDLGEFEDEETLKNAVRDNEGRYEDVKDLINKDPGFAVEELLNGYGYGPHEFGARNIYGYGEYSLDTKDFEVKSMDDLVKYMNDIDIPAQYIPDHTFRVTSRYGDVGVEDYLKTFDWEKAKSFAHDRLMSGFIVKMEDARDGSEAELDPGEYAEHFNGEFPIDPDRRFEVDYGDRGEER